MEPLLKTTPFNMTDPSPVDLLALKVEAYNAMKGDGDCPKCKGKGKIAGIRDGAMSLTECECLTKKRTLSRIQRSGLGELYERYTLGTFNTGKPWQEHIKRRALEYIANGNGWFYICGRSGSGKTHITAAITRELIDAGMDARYFMWRQDAPRLKALINERDRYDGLMDDLTSCRVLLVDDLWKGTVTEADINLTFELLNARYNQPSKLTIISSERSAQDILRIDEAIGGRIIERASGFVLQTGNDNVRLNAHLSGEDGT